MLKLPVILLSKASIPTPVLPSPVVVKNKEPAPIATLLFVVLLFKAESPTATLSVPETFSCSVCCPMAIFSTPVVFADKL